MNKRYSVNIFESAKQDVLDIQDYWENVLFHSAEQFIRKFYDEVDKLEFFPFSHPICQIPPLKEQGYRSFTVDNYYVFYIVESEEVQIHRVLYAGREISRQFTNNDNN